MQIQTIQYHEIKEWLLKKHYARRIPSVTDAFGIYENGILRGVCSFGIPASPNLCSGICGEEHKDKVFELNRLCVDDDFSLAHPGITSYFVGGCLRRMTKPNGSIIVSYADTKMGHLGIIYQATNWIYTGLTKERTDMGAGDGKHSRHGKASNERIDRSAKHRYVYFPNIGRYGRKNAKELRACLKYKPLPYPKGKTKRYDASYKPETQVILNLV